MSNPVSQKAENRLNSKERNPFLRKRRNRQRCNGAETPSCYPFADFMNIEEVFNLSNIEQSAKRCLRGVRWKRSAQNFELAFSYNSWLIHKEMLRNKYKCQGYRKMIHPDRGKVREINAPRFKDRVVQKCLCANEIDPVFIPKFIYDNGACLKKKGTKFSVDRAKALLHKYYLNNKSNDGYALTMDIKSFFKSINHQKIIDKVSQHLDPSLTNLYKYLINCFEGDTGLGLGSEISQISAMIYLNGLDHYIKDDLKIKYYNRHMDDSIIYVKTKAEAWYLLSKIRKAVEILDLKLNEKKTQIYRLKDGFPYLKRKIILHENGKIVVKPFKGNILRNKRKYRKLLKHGKFKAAAVVKQCFKGYLKEFNYIDRYLKGET